MQKSVIEYLEKTVSRFPDKIAVQDSVENISFKVLLESATKISHSLSALDLQRMH